MCTPPRCVPTTGAAAPRAAADPNAASVVDARRPLAISIRPKLERACSDQYCRRGTLAWVEREARHWHPRRGHARRRRRGPRFTDLRVVRLRLTRRFFHARRIVYLMTVEVIGKHVVAWAKYPGCDHVEADADRHAADPHVARRHRGPTDVQAVVHRNAPTDPSRPVAVAGDPCPTETYDPNPTPVVKHHRAKRVIAD